MNPTSMTTPPVQAIETASAGSKQKDSGAQDVPFSQVLSSEMAQNRSSRSTGEEADAGTEPGTEAAITTDEGTEAALATPTPPLAEQLVTVAPEALLALAINPDLVKQPAVPGEAPLAPPSDAEAEVSMDPLASPGGRKGPFAFATLPERLAEMASGAQKFGSAPAGKPDLPSPAINATNNPAINATTNPAINPATPLAATPATAPATTASASATAAAFAAQLAAARTTEVTQTGEVLADFMSHPALRASAPAPLEAPPLPDAAAGRLTPSVGTTAWGQALGEKIVWMAAGAQQTASLTLNPPNLGPLQVVLNVSNDQATASFFSIHPEVRQALEAALPRLKEMMNDAGIQLGQATVSADTPQQHDTSDRQGQRIAAPFATADEALPAGQQAVTVPVQRIGRGLVDTFA